MMRVDYIRAGNEDDIRRYLQERPTITGEDYGMLAELFEDMETGFAVVHRIAEELGVKVEGAPYL